MGYVRDEVLAHRFHLPKSSGHFVNALHDRLEFAQFLEAFQSDGEIPLRDAADPVDDRIQHFQLVGPKQMGD
ncbi:hypothetical protein D3C76_1477210 [compost metagenome]